MRTAAVLPVKSFDRAKQRLGDAVPDRARLAEAMLADVLSALAGAPGLDEVVVVTREERAARAAMAAGAVVVDDPVEAGQSAAATRGVEAATARRAERVLLVPGDCPALEAEDVAALLERPEPVVIVPDRHGHGTNALLLSPPAVIPPSFGPGSFARHAAYGRAAGAKVRVAELPSLALDVDTPADLAALAARSSGAERTRALLQRLAIHA